MGSTVLWPVNRSWVSTILWPVNRSWVSATLWPVNRSWVSAILWPVNRSWVSTILWPVNRSWATSTLPWRNVWPRRGHRRVRSRQVLCFKTEWTTHNFGLHCGPSGSFQSRKVHPFRHPDTIRTTSQVRPKWCLLFLAKWGIATEEQTMPGCRWCAWRTPRIPRALRWT